jgi:hypothetical protein
MPILINDTSARAQYTATASQTVFTVPFEFFANADLKVYRGSTLQTLTTHYTVTGAGVTGGGSITLVTGASAGEIVTIVRDVPVSRTTDFPTSGPFNVDALNTDLDRLTAMVQQQETLDTRSLRIDQFDTPNTLNALPSKTSRAGRILSFDANGQPSTTTTAFPEALTATNYIRVNSGGTAYELRAPASVRSDIGADDASNLTSGTVADARLPSTMASKTLTSVTISSGTITGITDLAIADGGTGASSASAARSNLGLVIGTDVQAYDPQLADIAGLTPTDNNFIVGNGTNFVTESGATARTSLGLGTIATQDASNVSITGGSISGVTFTYTTPLTVPGTASATGEIRLAEDTDNGTNYVGLKAPTSISADISWTLPAADGTSGQFLSTNGSGVLAWSSPAGGGDVTGPASSTDNAIVRFDLTSGKAIQNSTATLSDGGILQTTEVSTDTISEKTAAAGVTIDGVLLKDSAVTTDTINEKTAAAGVTIDSVLLKDGGATLTAPIILGAGSASTPSITTTGDTNTGIFFPAADTIAFAEGGAEVVRINSDSQVVYTAGTASLPAVTFTGDLNTGLYSPGADRIGFTEGGVQVGEFDASRNFLFNSGYGSVAIAYGCRAWVNFNGTGTVAIRASGNVSSITDHATGDYSVNFTNAMPDANYAVLGTSGQSAAANNMNCVGRNLDNSVQSTTAVRLYNLVTNTSGAIDNPNIFVGIFR